MQPHAKGPRKVRLNPGKGRTPRTFPNGRPR